MKTLTKWLRISLTAGMFMLFLPDANSQFLKKLGKRAQKAAERTVERRVDQEASKKTDQALDSILEPGSGGPAESPVPPTGGNDPNAGAGSGNTTNAGGNSGNANGAPNSQGNTGPKSLEVYSKFDFVPGDEVLFYDDFGDDFIGDFPARWNTNGSGEVVTLGDSPEKWLKMLPGYNIEYIPDVTGLPEDYTIEFDLMVNGMDSKTSSTAGITLTFSENNTFSRDGHWAWAFIPVGQYGAFDIRVRNFSPKEGSSINSSLRGDIRQAILNRPHIAIAVNGSRFRLWVNETKYVDIPQFIPETSNFSALKFNINGTKDGKEDIFITNLKVAKGGEDLRRKLLTEGSISTNAILFDSGSANLQPMSMGVIRQISQVLQQDGGMSLQIVGHTDSDGDADANVALSQARAEAVKKALVAIYGVDAGRLSTLGKGESEPVSDNNTSAGKAQNRRVEFIKQ